jgi:hypothetical protein
MALVILLCQGVPMNAATKQRTMFCQIVVVYKPIRKKIFNGPMKTK